MMYWMQANLAISVSITAHILPNDKTILMELGTFERAKRHLRKFDGIPKEHFEPYLKECERRFNNSEIKVLVPF